MNIHPILLVYTSHRVDCLKLCLDCLVQNTDIDRFKHIYIIANEVTLPHLLIAQDFCNQWPNASLVQASPRGLVPAVIRSVNSIIRQHPGETFVKIDEDVFVTRGWLDALTQCHLDHRANDEILLSAALCPISGSGYPYFKTIMERDLSEYYLRYASCTAELNKNKFLHRYLWEAVLEGGLLDRFHEKTTANYLYASSIVINCIMFDQRLVDEVYPFPLVQDPETGMACVDELAVNRALKGRKVAMPSAPVVHHYSHWRSEEYLRRHVPLSRVRAMLMEQKDYERMPAHSSGPIAYA